VVQKWHMLALWWISASALTFSSFLLDLCTGGINDSLLSVDRHTAVASVDTIGIVL
jgi:hypothetical protein